MWVKNVEVEIPFDVTLAAMVDRLKQPPSVLLKEDAAFMLRMWNLIGALDEAKAAANP